MGLLFRGFAKSTGAVSVLVHARKGFRRDAHDNDAARATGKTFRVCRKKVSSQPVIGERGCGQDASGVGDFDGLKIC